MGGEEGLTTSPQGISTLPSVSASCSSPAAYYNVSQSLCFSFFLRRILGLTLESLTAQKPQIPHISPTIDLTRGSWVPLFRNLCLACNFSADPLIPIRYCTIYIQAAASLLHNFVCYMVYFADKACLPFIMLVTESSPHRLYPN